VVIDACISTEGSVEMYADPSKCCLLRPMLAQQPATYVSADTQQIPFTETICLPWVGLEQGYVDQQQQTATDSNRVDQTYPCVYRIGDSCCCCPLTLCWRCPAVPL
jgi:hypothetical protein